MAKATRKAQKSPAERALEMVAKRRELGLEMLACGPGEAGKVDRAIRRRAAIMRKLVPLLVRAGGSVDLGDGWWLLLIGRLDERPTAGFLHASAGGKNGWGSGWSLGFRLPEARRLAAELARKAVAS
jgi:hypothetical protein